MKRIVICADGTWNQRDQFDKTRGTYRPTSVTKTARAVRPADAQGVSQVVYYHSGVGTGGPLDQLTGGAFGHGMAHNIREMYRFIVYNFEPGDELYLFGFSRGAYTVRSLAGFIDLVGLLTKEEDYYVPRLYRECYEAAQGRGSPAWRALFNEPGPKGKPRLADRRAACPPIRFLGVWDTVGALGAPGPIGALVGSRRRHEYHRVGLNPLVQNAAHALALDEQRKPFSPTLFVREAGWAGTLHQAWFAGVHTDVGGGYDYDDLANHALHWMLGHAQALGLALDAEYLKPFEPGLKRPPHNSMQWHYRWLLGGAVPRQPGATPGAEEVPHPSVAARLAAHPGYGSEALRRWVGQFPAG